MGCVHHIFPQTVVLRLRKISRGLPKDIVIAYPEKSTADIFSAAALVSSWMGIQADYRGIAFDKLWQWTDKTLRNKENGLFYWRYNPVAPNPVADKNDATDGDTLIAWALLRAQQQWHEKSYGSASDAITASLLKSTVVTFAGRQVMHPGAKGFYLNDHLNLNSS